MSPHLHPPDVSSWPEGGGGSHKSHPGSTEQIPPEWSRGRATSGIADMQAEIHIRVEKGWKKKRKKKKEKLAIDFVEQAWNKVWTNLCMPISCKISISNFLSSSCPPFSCLPNTVNKNVCRVICGSFVSSGRFWRFKFYGKEGSSITESSRTYSMTSLIPRPPHHPIFDCLRYAKTFNWREWPLLNDVPSQDVQWHFSVLKPPLSGDDSQQCENEAPVLSCVRSLMAAW